MLIFTKIWDCLWFIHSYYHILKNILNKQRKQNFISRFSLTVIIASQSTLAGESTGACCWTPNNGFNVRGPERSGGPADSQQSKKISGYWEVPKLSQPNGNIL